MRIERRFTKADKSPYADLTFRRTNSEIRNPDGSLVFKLDDIEVIGNACTTPVVTRSWGMIKASYAE